MLLNEDANVTHSELDQIRKRYADLFDFSPAGLFLIEDTGLIQKVNLAGAKILGINEVDLLNKNFSRYIAPDFQYEFSKYRKCMVKSMLLQTCELKLLQRHKPLFYAQLVGKASVDTKTGKVELLIMIATVSSRKQTEESSLQQNNDSSNNMPSNPMVTYLNQPLAIIANYIYGCIHRLESGNYQIPNVLQALKQAEQELHRTAEIIMRMKNFSCKEIFKYELMCINSVIEEVINLMNYEIVEYPVAISYRATKGLPKIMVDRIYLQQAILNLARNAVEAMLETNMPDPKLMIEINRPSKEIIEIKLIDNGPAFKLESVHKLFEPHFTTKTYGVGLGLAVSRIIVESHGGKLLVELNPTRGACFTVSLPIVPFNK